MTSTPEQFAVMFADVSGSSRLYESLGDAEAKALIDGAVSRMSELTREFNGTVVKTIGDEVMSRFPSATDALNSACAIQEHFEQAVVAEGSPRIAVRIGLHWGPAIIDETGDVFGDAINIAARMAGIAKARQIITTGDTVGTLDSALLGKVRLIDRTQVKGRVGELLVYDILWEARQDVTSLVPALTGVSSVQQPLVLGYIGGERVVRPDGLHFSIGRGETCDLTVDAKLASRQHAHIEYRRGKFILVDHSTNGTWVRTQDGKEVYLRREELPLWGSGVISLGDPAHQDESALLRFRLDEAAT